MGRKDEFAAIHSFPKPPEAIHPWRQCNGSFRCPRIMALSMVRQIVPALGRVLVLQRAGGRTV